MKKSKGYMRWKGKFSSNFNFFDIDVILNGKKEISTDVYYKNTNTYDFIPYDKAHPKPWKKNITYDLTRRIIVFVTDPEKSPIKTKWIKNLDKNNKYPNHIISNAFQMHLQGPAHVLLSLKSNCH